MTSSRHLLVETKSFALPALATAAELMVSSKGCPAPEICIYLDLLHQALQEFIGETG